MCGDPGGDDAICARCTHALPEGAPSAMCMPPLDVVVAPFAYAFPVDRLVQRFKFAGDLAAGRWLALQLAGHVRDLERPQLIVAPPLGLARLRSRGFNQALEVARVVGRKLRVPVAMSAIERTRETPPQQALGRSERRANVRGAFRCTQRFDGAHVAIVDDVVTTGATAAALASALREAGAARVSAWAIARTPE